MDPEESLEFLKMVNHQTDAGSDVHDSRKSESSSGENKDARKSSNVVFTLEEAIEQTKYGKYQIMLTILTGINLLGATIETANVSYIMPYAKCDLNLSTEEQGLLGAILYLGIVFTSHLWGFLADTWGRQKVLSSSAAGAFVFSFLSSFAPNTISMIILRFFTGTFISGSVASGISYINEFHTSSKSARAVAFVSIFFAALWLAMAPLAILIIPMDWSLNILTLEFRPWRLFLVCTSLITLWNAIAFALLPESPKFLLAMNRKEEALRVLSHVYAFNTGQSKENYPVKRIENVELGNDLSKAKGLFGFFKLVVDQTKPIFQKPLLAHTWKLCYLIFVMWAMGHGMLMWFADLLAQLQSYDGTTTKTLCEIVAPKPGLNVTEKSCTNIDNKNIVPFQLEMIISLCFMTIATLSGFYLKKVQPKMLVCGWLIAIMASSVLLNFLTEFYSTMISFVIFQSLNLLANVVIALTLNLYPTNYRGMATALVIMCGRIGGLVGSSGIGFIININCQFIFYLFSGILMSCFIIFMMIKLKSQ